MSTDEIPNSSNGGLAGKVTVDTPRVGVLMWVFLAAMLMAPLVLIWLARQGEVISNLRLWVALLALPPLLLFLLMPRRYRIEERELVLEGLFYRKRIPRSRIVGVESEPLLGALVRPGSIFCTDPSRALKIKLEGGAVLVISPLQAEPFLALGPAPEKKP